MDKSNDSIRAACPVRAALGRGEPIDPAMVEHFCERNPQDCLVHQLIAAGRPVPPNLLPTGDLRPLACGVRPSE